jgi:uncharacterized membrane protein
MPNINFIRPILHIKKGTKYLLCGFLNKVLLAFCIINVFFFDIGLVVILVARLLA